MALRPRSRLLLLLSCQQSILADAQAVDDALAHTYAPLLDALAAAPSQRVALHMHGYLLDRLARAHEGFLLRLKDFVASGQVELVGGLFYGGPPSLLHESDVRGQIAMLREFWASFVGEAPRGMYLPQLALCPELPRLVHDTGVHYVFAGTEQLQGAPFLARLRRGGRNLVTFGLHGALSRAYRPGQEAAWIRAAVAASQPTQPVGLHLAVEELAQGGPHVAARLGALFAALASAGGETQLPRHFVATPPPLPATTLVRPFAPWTPNEVALQGIGDWDDFAARFPEVERLHCRMLQASHRLADAIATMEDEGLDEAWSDGLATAQRHIFAAQSVEALALAPGGGVRDAAVRRAVLARLMEAEQILDGLQRGEGRFLAAQEGDIHGNLQPDVVVHGDRLTAWVSPSRGAAITNLEHRAWKRNVFDGGSGPAAAADLPGALRCAWFPADASMEDCMAGRAPDLLAPTYADGLPTANAAHHWRRVSTAVAAATASAAAAAAEPAGQAAARDAEGAAAGAAAADAAPPPYALAVDYTLPVDEASAWQLQHAVEVAGDRFGLVWRSRWQPRAAPAGAAADAAAPAPPPAPAPKAGRWALQLPLPQGDADAAPQVACNGAQLTPGAHSLPAGATVTIDAGAGHALKLQAQLEDNAEAPLTLWLAPAHAALWLSHPVGQGGAIAVRLEEAAANPP